MSKNSSKLFQGFSKNFQEFFKNFQQFSANFQQFLKEILNDPYRSRMWPGQFDEAMETMSFIYDNADDFQLERNRIVVAGDGIGATVAYAAALQLSSNGRKVRAS